MKNEVHVVWTGGLGTKDFAVEGMRKPSHRVPVRHVRSNGSNGGERPLHRVPGQSRSDMGIGIEVRPVVKLRERMRMNRGIYGNRGHRQQKHQPYPDSAGWFVALDSGTLPWRPRAAIDSWGGLHRQDFTPRSFVRLSYTAL